MKRLALALVVWLAGCVDETGIVLCVDAPGIEDGDTLEVQVTFASRADGPTCEVVRRVASPVPFCTAAKRGTLYTYAMAMQAVWRRDETEIGRRATVVPFEVEHIVEAHLDVGDCCTPSSSDHQCLATGCEPISQGTLDFFGDFVESGADCEQ